MGGSAGAGGVSTSLSLVLSQRASLQEAVEAGESFQSAACSQGLSHTNPPSPSLPPVTQIPCSPPQSLVYFRQAIVQATVDLQECTLSVGSDQQCLPSASQPLGCLPLGRPLNLCLTSFGILLS